MISTSEASRFLKGLPVTVLGAGESGMAAARWLARQDADVTVSDSRPVHRWNADFVKWCRDSGVQIEAGGHTRRCCTECRLMVVSPGIPAGAEPVRMAYDAGCMVVNDLVLAAAFYPGRKVGVTGTNGKTTTTMLITHLLEKAGFDAVAAGNISPPLFSVMESEVAVLEVSSFQLELLCNGWNLPVEKPDFDVSVWLNLAPDHLDRHGDIKKYGECKAQLLQLQQREGWAVINAGDMGLEPWKYAGEARRFFFSHTGMEKGPGAWIEGDGEICLRLEEQAQELEKYDLSQWHLSGRHNMENLAAGLSAARLVGADPVSLQHGIGSFMPPAHRFQKVAEHGGITYIDDSKATNAAAAMRALESLPGPAVLIAGGLGKDEDYTALAAQIAGLEAREMIRAVVVMGRDGQEIAHAVNSIAGGRIHIENAGEKGSGEEVMRRAVELSCSHAEPGDVVLLSPACASFDMFESYSQRGDIFQDIVKEISCT